MAQALTLGPGLGKKKSRKRRIGFFNRSTFNSLLLLGEIESWLLCMLITRFGGRNVTDVGKSWVIAATLARSGSRSRCVIEFFLSSIRFNASQIQFDAISSWQYCDNIKWENIREDEISSQNFRKKISVIWFQISSIIFNENKMHLASKTSRI